MVYRDNHIDSFEMGYTTKLNDKQAAAAVKVVRFNSFHLTALT